MTRAHRNQQKIQYTRLNISWITNAKIDNFLGDLFRIPLHMILLREVSLLLLSLGSDPVDLHLIWTECERRSCQVRLEISFISWLAAISVAILRCMRGGALLHFYLPKPQLAISFIFSQELSF